MVLRKVKRFRQCVVDMDGAPELETHREAEPDLNARLRDAVDELPERYRTVFVMHNIEGYTHEEIGVALGIQPGTSKWTLSKAGARLRAALADFAAEWK
jgi:RNA polymerase sigma-70 factor, ECF subfamily